MNIYRTRFRKIHTFIAAIFVASFLVFTTIAQDNEFEEQQKILLEHQKELLEKLTDVNQQLENLEDDIGIEGYSVTETLEETKQGKIVASTKIYSLNELLFEETTTELTAKEVSEMLLTTSEPNPTRTRSVIRKGQFGQNIITEIVEWFDRMTGRWIPVRVTHMAGKKILSTEHYNNVGILISKCNFVGKKIEVCNEYDAQGRKIRSTQTRRAKDGSFSVKTIDYDPNTGKKSDSNIEEFDKKGKLVKKNGKSVK